MPRRTPGKWYTAERSRGNAEVRFVRTDLDKSGVVGLTNDADAPLIAAAPELAASLRDVLELIDRFLDTEDWDDDGDKEILTTAWALLERINQ